MNKRLWLAGLVLFLAVLAGTVASVTYFRASLAPDCCGNQPLAREMDWLRHEYHLSNSQFERIGRLHADYALRAAEMCGRVCMQRALAQELIQAGRETTPEMAEALKATAALETECRMAALAHLYAVAAEMSPGEGRRYVAEMSACIVAPAMKAKTGASHPCCDTKRPQ